MKKAKVVELADFSAGMFSNYPVSQIPRNGLAYAQNVYWDRGLHKRPGLRTAWKPSTSPSLTNPTILASCYVKGNGKWTYVALIYDDSLTPDLAFIVSVNTSGTWSAYTTLSEYGSPTAATAPTYSSDRWTMKQYGEKVVAVDESGTDRPFVIFYDTTGGTWAYQTLDEEAKEAVDNDEWWAGTIASGTWTDDTTDAQDAGAADFAMPYDSSSKYHYVSSVVKFSKITYVTIASDVTAPGNTYEYYKGSGTWGSLTVRGTEPAWANTTTDTLQFKIPSDWAVWDGADPSGADGSAYGRYIIRVSITDPAASNLSCAYLTIENDQKISNIFGSDIPSQAEVHNARLFLAAKNTVHYSGYNQLNVWRDDEVEFFEDGGSAIRAMVSYKDALYVFKDAAVHVLQGTSVENFNIDKVLDYGTRYTWRSIEIVKDVLYFFDNHNQVIKFNGQTGEIVSKPIKELIASSLSPNLSEGTSSLWAFQILDKLGIMFAGSTSVQFIAVMDVDMANRFEGENDGSWWYWSTSVEFFGGDIVKNTSTYAQGEIHFQKNNSIGSVLKFPATESTKRYGDSGLSVGLETTGYACVITTNYMDFGAENIDKVYSRLKVRGDGLWFSMSLTPDFGTLQTIDFDDGPTSQGRVVLSGEVAAGSILLDPWDIGDLALGWQVSNGTAFYGGEIVTDILEDPESTVTVDGAAHTAGSAEVGFIPGLNDTEEKSIPYQCSGKLLQISITTQAHTARFAIDSMTIDYRDRRY